MLFRSGTGAGSTRETIELSREAAEAGADFVIVITSGYFSGALDRKALKTFFVDVAEKSPLPVILYNCKFDAVIERTSFDMIYRPWR